MLGFVLWAGVAVVDRAPDLLGRSRQVLDLLRFCRSPRGRCPPARAVPGNAAGTCPLGLPRAHGDAAGLQLESFESLLLPSASISRGGGRCSPCLAALPAMDFSSRYLAAWFLRGVRAGSCKGCPWFPGASLLVLLTSLRVEAAGAGDFQPSLAECLPH